jgi:cell fate (sporulation/competence/biofilm development) regulator YlbF (YheA/YmcA/DUF963 family)
MKNNVNNPPELTAAVDDLIRNLTASKPFLAYKRSQEQMHSDPQAHALLERLSALQKEIRRKQTDGGLTQEDLKDLRAVQADVQSNGSIIAFATSQQEAVSFLREINQEISQLLGVDFASLARQKTC